MTGLRAFQPAMIKFYILLHPPLPQEMEIAYSPRLLVRSQCSSSDVMLVVDGLTYAGPGKDNYQINLLKFWIAEILQLNWGMVSVFKHLKCLQLISSFDLPFLCIFSSPSAIKPLWMWKPEEINSSQVSVQMTTKFPPRPSPINWDYHENSSNLSNQKLSSKTDSASYNGHSNCPARQSFPSLSAWWERTLRLCPMR